MAIVPMFANGGALNPVTPNNGNPNTIYNQPRNPTVAPTLGPSPVNLAGYNQINRSPFSITLQRPELQAPTLARNTMFSDSVSRLGLTSLGTSLPSIPIPGQAPVTPNTWGVTLKPNPTEVVPDVAQPVEPGGPTDTVIPPNFREYGGFGGGLGDRGIDENVQMKSGANPVAPRMAAGGSAGPDSGAFARGLGLDSLPPNALSADILAAAKERLQAHNEGRIQVPTQQLQELIRFVTEADEQAGRSDRRGEQLR